jgi:hypothetical protein
MKFSPSYSPVSTSTRSSEELEHPQQLELQEFERRSRSRLILGYPKHVIFLIVVGQLILIGLVGMASYWIGKQMVVLKECGSRLSTWCE